MKGKTKDIRQHHGLLSDFFWRSFQLFGKYAVGIVVFFISARLLSPFDFGVYNYAMAIVFTVALLSDFGISLAMSRFVARYNGSAPEKVYAGMFQAMIIILIFSSLLAAFVFFAGAQLFSRLLPYYWLIFPLFYLMPLAALYDGVYRGRCQFRKLSIITGVSGAVALPLVYSLVYFFGLRGALVSQAIFYGLLLLLLFSGSPQITISLRRKDFWEIFSYSLLAGIGIFAQLLNAKIDVIMLEWFSFIEEIAYYEIANKIVQLSIMPAFIFASVIAPRSTQAIESGDTAILKRNLLRHSLVFFLLAIPVAAFLLLSFPLLVRVFLPEYVSVMLFSAFNLLAMLLPFRYLYSIIASGYMIPCGFAFLSAFVGILSGIINVCFNLLLIEQYGLIGVVISTMIAAVFSALAGFAICYRLLGRVSVPAAADGNDERVTFSKHHDDCQV